ncbi:MAG TPA: hypothetical protein VH370_05800 [Humisphaera sp.]|nr:hypothetical protein [Humisphaera sp.]
MNGTSHGRLAANDRRATLEALEPRRLLSFASFPFPAAPPGSNELGDLTATAGADGNIWILDGGSTRIVRITHSGATTQFPLPAKSDLIAIAAGPDGNIWFADDALNKIGKITPAGKLTEFSVSKSIGLAPGPATTLVAGPDGNLWFTAFDERSSASLIGRITPQGAVTTFAVPNSVDEIDGITRGPDGNLWFSGLDDVESPLLGRITPRGKVTLFPYSPAPGRTSFPFFNEITSIISGPDGNLWISSSDEIDKITTSGQVIKRFISDAPSGFGNFPVRLFDLTLGPDGNFWFRVNQSSNQLGRLTSAGAFSNITIPRSQPFAIGNLGNWVQVSSITSGADGDLWLTTFGATLNILRLDPRNSILPANEYVDTSAGSAVKAVVAQFIDTGAARPASDYRASITFDDGTTARGTITAGPNGKFAVSVTRAWPLNTSTATVAIIDVHNASRTASAYDFVTAVPQQPIGTALTINAVAGTVFDGRVARFVHIDLPSLDQYGALIDWGDGQQSDATLVADGAGGAWVVGSHAYAQAGHYSIQVGVSTPDVEPRVFGTGGDFPPEGEVTSRASVVAGAMAGTGYTLLAQSHHALTQNEATFTLADPSADISHFHAQLEWHDPSTDPQHPTIAATIQPRGGLLLVRVPVTFGGQGIAYYRVVIHDDRRGSGDAAIVGVAYGQILVDYPATAPPADFDGSPTVDLFTAQVQGATGDQGGGFDFFEDNYNPSLSERVFDVGQALTGTAGMAVSGDIGRLAFYVPNAPNLKDLHGTILWGDGTTSAATFTRDSKGFVHVKGLHAYGHPGKYSIAVYLSQTLYENGKPEGLPDLHLPTLFSSIRVAAD